jgi:hypothetical protein
MSAECRAQSAERRAAALSRLGRCVALLAFLPFFLSACAGKPAQKPAQTIAPDSATVSSLKDVQASVLSLAQQNTAIINAVQKSAQDADQFRTETKGGIASLTQNQFRLESWLAETTRHWRLRVLGVGAYPGPGALPGDQLVGVGGDLPGHPGLVPGSAVPGAGGKAHGLEKGPTMLELLIAFVLGVVAASVFAALESGMAATIATDEKGVILEAVAFVVKLWNKIFGKKAATTAK